MESDAAKIEHEGGAPAVAATTLGEAVAEGYFSDAAATLGDRLAAARQSARLTQAGLAARLGVGAKVISGWENDRSEPRANSLAMLAGLLGVSVSWLLTGAGEGVAPPEADVGLREKRPAILRFVVELDDLDAARAFYADRLGCATLEMSDAAARFDFFGHRLEARRGGRGGARSGLGRLELALDWEDWLALVNRLRGEGVEFASEPSIDAVGAPDERGAFELRDPSGARLVFAARRHTSEA